MTDKYEYHKQNDYPGERVAERKRVSDREDAADERADARVAEKGRTETLKADNRVAKRGRMDDELMDAEKQRSATEAQRVNRSRNRADTIGLFAGAIIIVLLIAGLSWSVFAIRGQNDEIDTLNSQIANCGQTPLSNANTLTDTTRPTITSMSASPVNNKMGVATHSIVTVQFSEPIDASTINGNTFTVMQRTTPEAGSAASEYRSMQLEGVITYDGLTATFTPKPSESNNPMQPSQEYGNVFTVTLTTGVKDLTGNSLSQDYVWSFTTGGDAFNTGATTSQTG